MADVFRFMDSITGRQRVALGLGFVLIVAVVLFLLRFVLGFYSRRKHRPSVRFNYYII